MAYTDIHSFHDDLDRSTKFCATVGPIRREYFLTGMVHSADETGTATFVRHRGNTFCLTAKHVVEALDPDGTQGVFLPKAPGHVIFGPFLPWIGQIGDPSKDIVISCISDTLLAYIGKEALDLDRCTEPSRPIKAAMAVGFPTLAKFSVQNDGRKHVRMPGVFAVAEGIGSSTTASQMQFRTETPIEPSFDLSGMSGGPVFWSDETDKKYGLLGLVKEAMPSKPFDVNGVQTHSIHYLVERTMLDQLRENLERVTREWQTARDALIAKLKSD